MFTRYTHLDEELGTDVMEKLVTYMEGWKSEGTDLVSKRKEDSNMNFSPSAEDSSSSYTS